MSKPKESRPSLVADWEIALFGEDEPHTITRAVLRRTSDDVALLDPVDSEPLFFADRKAVAYVRRVGRSTTGE